VGAMRSRTGSWLAAGGLMAMVLGAVAAPAGATPGPTVDYAPGPITVSCVLAPGVLNETGSGTLTTSVQGPAFVESGDAYTLQDGSFALTTPGSTSIALVGLGSSWLGGVMNHYTIDGTDTTPSSIDTAQQPPWNSYDVLEFNEASGTTGTGAGFPIGPVAVTSAPMTLSGPVSLLSGVQPDGPQNVPPGSLTTFDAGPFTVAGAAGGTSNLTLDPAAGFTGPPYTLTGNGIVLSTAGYTDNPLTPDALDAGPLTTACNVPVSGSSGPSLGSIPIVAPLTFGPTTITTSGSTVTFTAHPNSTPLPAATYQWQVSTDGGTTWSNDTTDSGDTTTVLTVTAGPGNSGDEFRLTGTNSVSNPSATPSGPFVVSNATTQGSPLPPLSTAPAVTQQPVNASVTAGQTATFTAAASGSPTPTVQWQVSTNGGTAWSNDAADSGATTGTLSVAASSAANGDQYRAVFTNSAGTATSNAATLTVTAPSNAPVVTALIPRSGFMFSVVIIEGRNLRGATAVNFGSTKARFFLRLTDRLILALAPAPPSAGGTVDVTVTTPVGTSAATAADQFTYESAG